MNENYERVKAIAKELAEIVDEFNANDLEATFRKAEEILEI